MERAVIKSAGSSPHTRGARHPFRNARRQLRIIPAYAGSTTTLRRPSRISWDHPRIRGEHDCSIYFTNFPTGSSPHTRGAQGDRRHPCAWVGIIPAYAGSTRNKPPIPSWKDGSSPHTRGARPSTEDSTRAWTDHPRIRGEHLGWLSGSGGVVGSSPHTRGARRLGLGRRQTGRIIPAYAGSTRSGTSNSASTRDHPRIRGEHQRRQRRREAGAGSSPHTRGAPPHPAHLQLGIRIIPAYAGSTCRKPSSHRRIWDHPRIRGEHDIPAVGGPYVEGSSPHTRGAPSGARARRQRQRIIPAYAGSTPKEADIFEGF